MAITIRAHYDGKVIVPDEPVDWPVGQPLEVELKSLPNAVERAEKEALIAERLRRLEAASGRIAGPVLPTEMSRRQNFYAERELRILADPNSDGGVAATLSERRPR